MRRSLLLYVLTFALLGGFLLGDFEPVAAKVKCDSKFIDESATWVCSEDGEATYECNFSLPVDIEDGGTATLAGKFGIVKGVRDLKAYQNDRFEGKKIVGVKNGTVKCEKK